MVELDGILTSPDLRRSLTLPLPHRVVVTPLTDPERQIGSNSIDLKLGCELLVPRHGRTAYLDLRQRAEAIGDSMEVAHQHVRLAIGDEFILHEHQFAMATTLEFIGLPQNLGGYIIGRSSWERVGLHVRPARIPPGYRGCVQLQLVSHKDLPISLIAGARICQLLLFPVSSPVTSSSHDSVTTGPGFSAILDDEELLYLQRNRYQTILGIAGTIASGKSSLAEYLIKEHGFLHLSLATPVYEEASRRGLGTTGKDLQDVGNSLRHYYSTTILVDRLSRRIQALPRESNLVLTGIKNIDEVSKLRRWPNFRLISVDAPIEVRYQRAIVHGAPRAPSSREEFDRLDSRDRGVGEPEWGQQVDACIASADFPIQGGGSLEELYPQLEEYLRSLRDTMF